MVKVIQERRCKPGKEEDLKNLLEELRSRAFQRYGSYAWETLRSEE